MFEGINLKKVLKELFITAITIFVVLNLVSYFQKPELESDLLPSFDVVLLDGNRFTSKNSEGKPLVVHVWGKWCRVCRMEESNIQKLSEHYNVLSIAVKSGSDTELQVYMQKNGLTFKVLNDKEAVWARKFKVEVFPTTFIYDAEGKLRFTEVGYTTTAGLFARMKMAESF